MKKLFLFIFLSSITLSILILKFEKKELIQPQAQAQTTDANLKVAFIGDTGAGSSFQDVLNLIKSENAQMVLHQGDFDYSDGPQKWMNMINTTLGSNFPYFASDGNHDEWEQDGYSAFFKDRLGKIGESVPAGTLPPSYTINYKGLKIVFGKENGDSAYLDSQLKNATNTWKICSWHKNMKAMQIGGKSDEQGWADYETCRKYGAIIATAHEHSYERTKTLVNTQTQQIDTTCSDPKNICVSPGRTFAFVSGLGGNSIRNQDLCLPTTYPYGCKGEWASIYTADQGAKYGALFIVFNYNGDPNKAHGYFKNTAGQIIDEFNISTGATTNPTNNPTTPIDPSIINPSYVCLGGCTNNPPTPTPTPSSSPLATTEPAVSLSKTPVDIITTITTQGGTNTPTQPVNRGWLRFLLEFIMIIFCLMIGICR